MKKIIITLCLTCLVLFASDTVSSDDNNCVETIESEVVKIVHSKANGEEKQKAIDLLKKRVSTNNHDTCESQLQEEIKRLVFGDKKVEPNSIVKKHIKKIKANVDTADMNAQDCIANFEAEVIKIINSNPNNSDKEKTKQIMHEIMHESVKENCESEFKLVK
ncbi:hypothetical protein [Sulfurospirillum arcachonense]|uniref:hypothetical protein n=1 Tax=Sulfurospirillum arcachonense TaxID=57666 RepID=UPI000469E8EC|nr:hypothetical protein [Sulfurospirillum arcachonense]